MVGADDVVRLWGPAAIPSQIATTKKDPLASFCGKLVFTSDESTEDSNEYEGVDPDDDDEEEEEDEEDTGSLYMYTYT